ncbi:MAG: hypothetical protein RLZZ76_405 [Candidatus Parcubacteria bacterium]|jgi:hypothetical protein
MVAPLIVGAARVVGKEKLVTHTVQPERINRVQRRKSRKDTQGRYVETSRTTTETDSRAITLQNSIQKGEKTSQNKSIIANRVKAFGASMGIFTTAIWFALPQIIFWMIGLLGLSGSSIPLASYVFPGELIYMVTYVCIATIGIGTMVYACVFYSVRRVRCFSGYKGVVFVLSLTGYLIIFINFFPWFTIWLVAVTYMQEE